MPYRIPVNRGTGPGSETTLFQRENNSPCWRRPIVSGPDMWAVWISLPGAGVPHKRFRQSVTSRFSLLYVSFLIEKITGEFAGFARFIIIVDIIWKIWDQAFCYLKIIFFGMYLAIIFKLIIIINNGKIKTNLLINGK